MKAKRQLRRDMGIALMAACAVLACSSETPPGAGAQQGAPSTGAAATSEGIPGPTDAQLHESRVKSVLAKNDLDGASELAKWRTAPLVEARIELDKASFDGRWNMSVVNNGSEVIKSIAFEVPVNRVSGRPASVTLKAVKVGGVDVSAGGTAARWEIPIDLAPGKRAELELAFAGALPRVRAEADSPDPLVPGSSGVDPQGKLDLSALLGQLGNTPELRRLVPVVPVLDGAAAFAQYDGLTVLAGCLPALITGPGVGPVGVASFEVLVGSDREVDVTGHRVGRERDGTRTMHRFIALGEPEIAVVVTRGRPPTNVILADVPITLRVAPEALGSPSGLVAEALGSPSGLLPEAMGSPSGLLPEASQELTALLRRALEELETRWGGHGPSRLTVVAVDRVGSDDASGPAVGSLAGIILVPAGLLGAPKEADPSAAPGGAAAPQGISLSGMLGAMIEHHPAAREALTFAVATAVGQQWWAGVGSDDAADNILRQGFARAGALAVVAGKGGDKAERRALEFGLRMPIQVALQQGGKDIALAGVSRSNDVASTTLAALKAGLFVDTLARHLGEQTMVTLAQRLFAAPRVTLERLRADVLAVAPRPEETRVFLERWLDETHLSEDVGPLRPEVLLEYFVTDGAVGSLTSQLMGQLGPNQLGGRALELLAQGKDLDAGMALTLLGDLAGQNVDPSIKKWLTLGTGLLGGGDDRKRAVEGLVDVLGGELGIPESDRSRLRQLSTILLEELAKETVDAPAPNVPPAPPAPAP